jgi:hypothetical protein
MTLNSLRAPRLHFASDNQAVKLCKKGCSKGSVISALLFAIVVHYGAFFYLLFSPVYHWYSMV